MSARGRSAGQQPHKNLENKGKETLHQQVHDDRHLEVSASALILKTRHADA